MIYTYLGVLCGFSFVILSMAEMASMCDNPRTPTFSFISFYSGALMMAAVPRKRLLTLDK